MCDWLVFYPDTETKTLCIEILMSKLIELQPDTVEEADDFCDNFYPVIDKIQAMCIENGWHQACSANLEGIRVHEIKPMVMVRIIWNIYEHTKNCILLQECEVSGGGAFFNTLVETVRGFLPPFMRNMVKLIPDSKKQDSEDED
jgi:hypothetical protein